MRLFFGLLLISAVLVRSRCKMKADRDGWIATPKVANVTQLVEPSPREGDCLCTRTACGGDKGPKGDKGDAGPPGLRGQPGLPGQRGPPGDKGAQGPMGPHGLRGANGKDGIPGSNGSQGARGDKGVKGGKGDTGSQGGQGSPGSQGIKGEKGVPGSPGSQGARGVEGPRGQQGNSGPPGVQGPKGSSGTTGSPGSPGTRGLPGPPGAKGDTGAKGIKGLKGLQGSKGPRGATGGQGPPGPHGPKGSTGVTGKCDNQCSYLKTQIADLQRQIDELKRRPTIHPPHPHRPSTHPPHPHRPTIHPPYPHRPSTHRPHQHRRTTHRPTKHRTTKYRKHIPTTRRPYSTTLGSFHNPALSCKHIKASNRRASCGRYWVKTSTRAEKSEVFCAMSNIAGCGRGGYTMVMKLNGRANTFRYTSPYWSNQAEYNPSQGRTGFDGHETKLATYWSTPFNFICLGMRNGKNIKFIRLRYRANSLSSLIADGRYRKTHAGRNAWKSLILGSSLQRFCSREGFNVNFSFRHFSAVKARIGIAGNQEKGCLSPDSRIAFGGGGSLCGQDTGNTCGNEAKCSADRGDRHTKTFGYILVQ